MVKLVREFWELFVMNPPNSKTKKFVWLTGTQETLVNFVCFVSSFILQWLICVTITSIDYIAFIPFFRHNGNKKWIKIVSLKTWREKTILETVMGAITIFKWSLCVTKFSWQTLWTQKLTFRFLKRQEISEVTAFSEEGLV